MTWTQVRCINNPLCPLVSGHLRSLRHGHALCSPQHPNGSRESMQVCGGPNLHDRGKTILSCFLRHLHKVQGSYCQCPSPPPKRKRTLPISPLPRKPQVGTGTKELIVRASKLSCKHNWAEEHRTQGHAQNSQA